MSFATMVAARSRRSTSARAAVIATVALLAAPAAASANPVNITSGRAYDIAIKASPLSTTVFVGPDTGLISNNQTTSTSLSAASVNTAIGKATALNASVATNKNESAIANASAALAAINVPGLPKISAGVITAQSKTSCRNRGTSSGSAVTGTITVNGTTYPIASPPNTTIPLPGGSLILNEQKKITNGLLVNAIHIHTILGVDVVISSASSAVSNCGIFS